MQTRFSARAKRELEAQAEWYSEHSPKAASMFLDALERRLNLIEKYPTLFPVVHRGVRKVLLGKFPVTVYYRTDGQTLEILSIKHQAQKNPFE